MNKAQEIAVDIIITEDNIENCLHEYNQMTSQLKVLRDESDAINLQRNKVIDNYSREKRNLSRLRHYLSGIEEGLINAATR